MANGVLLPNLWLYALDSVGVALPGSLLNMYAAGTSTRIDTFSDIALTIANTNPLVADGAGRFGPIYVTPGLSYKAVWTTAAGDLLRTLDNIPAGPSTASIPPADNSLADLRLSLTSGVPVTTGEVTGSTSFYVEPHDGNRIALYDGSAWNLRTVVSTPVAVPNLANTNFDVFAYDNNTVPTYELLAWTNDTTRATALTRQDGILVKSGVVTRRWIGGIRTTAVAGQTEDSFAKRFVFNAQHRLPRRLAVADAMDSWTYSADVYRQARGQTTNQVACLIGYPDTLLQLTVWHFGIDTMGTANIYASIGEDSTTTPINGIIGQAATCTTTIVGVPMAFVTRMPTVGYHFYAWLERSATAAITSWYGDNGDVTKIQSGLTGWVLA
jgi:hypothetical protein